MKLVKRKIVINDLGKDVNLKIGLFQSIDNMGLMTDMPFDGSCISPCSNPIPLIFMNKGISSVWYKQGDKVIHSSDSKLNEVKSYDNDDRYKVNFDIKKEDYSNYQGTLITGVDRVTNISGETITYVLNAKRDATIGTTDQTTGILYTDNSQQDLFLPDELDSEKTITKVEYMSEGWNVTNTSLEPQIQEEYLLGIISQPEVESDVFIDRSTFSVLDKHLRLSEIESLDHLTRYGNGFYNINRD
jgi:hypothetical protein